MYERRDTATNEVQKQRFLLSFLSLDGGLCVPFPLRELLLKANPGSGQWIVADD
jgi:hypothetical protein